MENINITKKYTLISQALLVATVLFAVSPILAFAENAPIEVGFNDPIEVGFNDPIEVGFNDTQPIEVGFNPSPVQPNPIIATPAVYTSPSFVVVSSGSFFGGGYGATSAGYSPVSATTPSSGGFSGGTSNLTQSNFSLVSTQGINSGGYSAGFIPNNNFFPLPNNQVLALNDTPNLSSVYLSDVPYTGAGDVLKVILFTLSLILWSILLTYAILKRKQENQEVFIGIAETAGANSYGIPSQITSDKEALEGIENYARENKILLSTSASTKLLKLERLNKVNSKDLISKISKEDWVCVGEADLEKYL